MMKHALGLVVSMVSLCAVASPARASTPAGTDTPIEAPGPLAPLKGSLRMPAGAASAAVLIVPGSGPTDRDGNNPLGVQAASYRLLADALAAQGIASLRFDKRGMFASMAAVRDGNAVTIGDYGADVQAWLDVLRRQTALPCAWVIGHSEGGLVALAAAATLRGACGLVLLAAPGRPMGTLLREQLRANPANAPVLPQAMAAIETLERGQRVDTSGFHPGLQPLFNPAVQGFLISVLAQDPQALIAGLSLPVLVVQGERDLQVSLADARALQQAQPRAKLVLLPAMNHVLKAVATDDRGANVASYADPALPLAPGLVEAMVAFIRAPAVATAAPAASEPTR